MAYWLRDNAGGLLPNDRGQYTYVDEEGTEKNFHANYPGVGTLGGPTSYQEGRAAPEAPEGPAAAAAAAAAPAPVGVAPAAPAEGTLTPEEEGLEWDASKNQWVPKDVRKREGYGEPTEVVEEGGEFVEKPRGELAMIKEGIMGAGEGQKEAIRGEAKAKQASLDMQSEDWATGSEALKTYQDETARQQKIAERKANDGLTKLMGRIEDHRSMKVDTNFYRRSTAGTKIGMMVSAILGGWMQPLKGGEVEALGMLERMIERDRTDQREDIAKAGRDIAMERSIWSDSRSLSKDHLEARNLHAIRMWQQVERDIKGKMLKFAGDAEKQRGEKLLHQTEQKKQLLLYGMLQDRIKNEREADLAKAKKYDMYARRRMLKKTLPTHQLKFQTLKHKRGKWAGRSAAWAKTNPDGFFTVGRVNPNRSKKLSDKGQVQAEQSHEALRDLAEYIGLMKRYKLDKMNFSFKHLDTAKRRELEALHNSIATAVRNSKETGVMTDPDFKRYFTDIVPGINRLPDVFKGSFMPTLTRLRTGVVRKHRTNLKNTYIDLDPHFMANTESYYTWEEDAPEVPGATGASEAFETTDVTAKKLASMSPDASTETITNEFNAGVERVVTGIAETDKEYPGQYSEAQGAYNPPKIVPADSVRDKEEWYGQKKAYLDSLVDVAKQANAKLYKDAWALRGKKPKYSDKNGAKNLGVWNKKHKFIMAARIAAAEFDGIANGYANAYGLSHDYTGANMFGVMGSPEMKETWPGGGDDDWKHFTEKDLAKIKASYRRGYEKGNAELKEVYRPREVAGYRAPRRVRERDPQTLAKQQQKTVEELIGKQVLPGIAYPGMSKPKRD